VNDQAMDYNEKLVSLNRPTAPLGLANGVNLKISSSATGAFGKNERDAIREAIWDKLNVSEEKRLEFARKEEAKKLEAKKMEDQRLFNFFQCDKTCCRMADVAVMSRDNYRDRVVSRTYTNGMEELQDSSRRMPDDCLPMRYRRPTFRTRLYYLFDHITLETRKLNSSLSILRGT